MPTLRRSLLIATVLLAASSAPAGAISTTCLPGGLPSVVGAPSVGKNVTWSFDDQYRIDLWRESCQDGSGVVALLMRVTPITSAPRVCHTFYRIIQDGIQRNVLIVQGPGGANFCADLLVATTLSLETAAGHPAIDNKAEIILDVDQAQGGHTTLTLPTAVPTLGVAVVATGCTACAVGQLAQFHLRVTNPGPPFVGELKTAVHLPGGAVATLLGFYVEETVQTGEYEIPLLGLVVPGDVPKGVYILEAAILDRATGVTLTRDSLQATVQ